MALEAAGDKLASDPVAAPCLLPELRRVPTLEDDLAVLLGQAWREPVRVLPATADDVARHEGIEDAATYLAHAYTRYLGDLSGGQVVARMLQRHYNMDAEELSFYTFAGIPKSKPFKDQFQALMDDAPFITGERERMVEEAGRAFDLNAAPFVDLAGEHAGSAPAGTVEVA